jgi:hypothetical protein
MAACSQTQSAPTYTDFLVKYPEYYDAYKALVNHAQNCYDELCRLHLLDDVSTLLSIGAGEGDLEVQIAQQHGVAIGYIDPSHRSQQQFHAAMQQRDLQTRVREIFPGTFEDYQSPLRYDLVIAIHSWYSFGYNASIIQKALACRAAQGVLCIAVESRNSLGYDLACLSPMSGMDLHSEKLSAWATTRGYAHTHHVYRKSLPFSLFVRDGHVSEEGKHYAAFLATTPWNELSAATQKDILGLFDKHRHGDRIDLQCGCLLFNGRQ